MVWISQFRVSRISLLVDKSENIKVTKPHWSFKCQCDIFANISHLKSKYLCKAIVAYPQLHERKYLNIFLPIILA